MSTAVSNAAVSTWMDWPAALRLHHWPKCLVVLVGLLPTGAFRDPSAVGIVILAAVLFQMGAAGGYLVNDLLDLRRDRIHPRKRYRPLASGRISAPSAAVAALVLISSSIAGGWWLSPGLGLVLSIYALLTLAYSLWLKHAVACDILTIAAIFVLRSVAGVVVIGAYVSVWFLLSVGSLALLLALGKRLGEVRLLSETARVHRITLRQYQHPAWRHVLLAVATVTVGCYAVASSISPTARIHPWVMVTILPVALGVWRYSQIVSTGGGDEPERLLLRDRLMGACALGWVVIFIVALLA